MTLYKVYETRNNEDPFLKGIYLTRELAEEKIAHPTISCHAALVDGKYKMVPDSYSYSIEEFEWDKELTFDVYILCPKTCYSTRCQRIAGLSWDKANELYNKYSEKEYVELQLPQKQFGSYSITLVKGNRDDNYWKLQKQWEEEQEQDPMNWPENEPVWMR